MPGGIVQLVFSFSLTADSPCRERATETRVDQLQEVVSELMAGIKHLVTRTKNLIKWLSRLVYNGFRFGIINRNLRPVAVSCFEYWMLGVRARFDRSRRRWNPETPCRILGLKLYTFSADTLFFLVNEIFLDRAYAFASKRSNPTIIDCGSNIGISILFFKKMFPRAHVIGFEPDRITFELLSRNLSENGITDVVLHNAAVSMNRGEIRLFTYAEVPGSVLMSTVRESPDGAAQTVPSVQLSEYIHGPIDLLKIDVEGAELDVMTEIASSQVLNQVEQIIMEYHHHIHPDDDRFSQMLQLLEKNCFGYCVDARYPKSPAGFQDIELRIYRTHWAGAEKRESQAECIRDGF